MTLAQVCNTCTELIVLLNLLNHGSFLDHSRSSTVGGSHRKKSSWHCFLDDFASLGDVRRGGQTVTATAGVKMGRQRTLLVGCNSGIKPCVQGHLEFVLGSLQDLANGDMKTPQETQTEILEKSIELSRDRVHNYVSRLKKLIERLVKEKKSDQGSDKELYKRLNNITAQSHDYVALCKAAYTLSKEKKTEGYLYLDETSNTVRRMNTMYYLIRHYVGRLGSWHRACMRLVHLAVHKPGLLQGLTLVIIRQQVAASQFSELATSSLRKLIEKLKLGLDTNLILENLQKLYEKIPRDDKQGQTEELDFEQIFRNRLTECTSGPVVHAEALTADFIFGMRLSYIGDSHYIGCSKPSCLCCDWYLQFHPDNVKTQSCHGNLWAKWSPPIIGDQIATYDVEDVVRRMIQGLTAIFKDQILTGKINTNRLLESLTGITKS